MARRPPKNPNAIVDPQEDPELWRNIQSNVQRMDDLYDATFYTWLKSEENVLVTASYLQRLSSEYEMTRIEHALCWLVSEWRLESIAILVKQVTFDWHLKGDQGEQYRARLVLALTENWAIQYLARLTTVLLSDATCLTIPVYTVPKQSVHSRMSSASSTPLTSPLLLSPQYMPPFSPTEAALLPHSLGNGGGVDVAMTEPRLPQSPTSIASTMDSYPVTPAYSSQHTPSYTRAGTPMYGESGLGIFSATSLTGDSAPVSAATSPAISHSAIATRFAGSYGSIGANAVLVNAGPSTSSSSSSHQASVNTGGGVISGESGHNSPRPFSHLGFQDAPTISRPASMISHRHGRPSMSSSAVRRNGVRVRHPSSGGTIMNSNTVNFGLYPQQHYPSPLATGNTSGGGSNHHHHHHQHQNLQQQQQHQHPQVQQVHQQHVLGHGHSHSQSYSTVSHQEGSTRLSQAHHQTATQSHNINSHSPNGSNNNQLNGNAAAWATAIQSQPSHLHQSGITTTLTAAGLGQQQQQQPQEQQQQHTVQHGRPATATGTWQQHQAELQQHQHLYQQTTQSQPQSPQLPPASITALGSDNNNNSTKNWMQPPSFPQTPVFSMNKPLFIEYLSKSWSFCRLSEFFQCMDSSSGINHRLKCSLLKNSALKEELKNQKAAAAAAAAAAVVVAATAAGVSATSQPTMSTTAVVSTSDSTVVMMGTAPVTLMPATSASTTTVGASNVNHPVPISGICTSSTTTTTTATANSNTRRSSSHNDHRAGQSMATSRSSTIGLGASSGNGSSDGSSSSSGSASGDVCRGSGLATSTSLTSQQHSQDDGVVVDHDMMMDMTMHDNDDDSSRKSSLSPTAILPSAIGLTSTSTSGTDMDGQAKMINIWEQ